MAGRSHAAVAGLIEGVWDFDAGFFGLSAREATQMDPQQRLLLMTAWEALEDAGLTPARLARLRVGVYVGCAALDHSARFAAEPERIDAQFMTGNTLSIVANRISHCLDLDGPSCVVDTACSSSLFALDHAVQALAAGRIDAALVGGVHLLLSPYPFIGFSRAGMLSRTGRINAFGAEADGYVRGEGAGVAVLMRLAEAMEDGDRVRTVVAATTTGASGRHEGMTRPVAARQAALIAAAATQAQAGPEYFAFVEAHGTGTPIGDPQEASAIGQILGRGRAAPLPIGSVKTNIGHLEPASGIAGLIKAALALEAGMLPASLHGARPSPDIDFTGLNLRLADRATALPPRPERGGWRALVNSFGFGGANACAVLRQPPPFHPAPPAAAAGALILSAASAASLDALIERWRERLADTPVEAAETMVAGAAHRRARLSHRAIVLPAEGDTAAQRLAKGAVPIRGMAPARGRGTVFVFAGNGSQYPGMGAHFLATDRVYANRFDEICALFAETDPDLDIRAWLHEADIADHLRDATRAQPILLALQLALVETLAHQGLRPDAVAGHSVGEVAAACCAGAITAREATALIATRTPLLRRLQDTGGMAAVLAGADETRAALAASGIADLVLSADNSPRSCSISGTARDIAAFARLARDRRLAVRPLDIAYPYHSPALAPLEDAFHDRMPPLHPRAARIPIASATTGGLVAGERLDAAFWWSNLRQPVRFREAAAALAPLDPAVVMEIGPRPVLRAYLADTLREAGRQPAILGSLDSRPQAAPQSPAHLVALALAHGATVDETRLLSPPRPWRGGLPPYQWDLSRACIADDPGRPDPLAPPDNPLLGNRIQPDGAVWESLVDTALFPWLGDHRVAGRPVMPAMALAALALEAGAALGPSGAELADFDLLAVMEPDRDGPRRLRTSLEPTTGIVRIESRGTRPTGEWLLHARGTLRAAPPQPAPDGPAASDRGQGLAPEEIYAALEGAGLAYGPAFRRVSGGAICGPVGRAQLRSNDPVLPGARLDPTLADGALHMLQPMIAAALPDDRLGTDLLIPVRIGRLRLSPEAGPPCTAELRLTRISPREPAADIVARDATGRICLGIQGLRLRRIPATPRHEGPMLWQERWVRLDPAQAAPPAPTPSGAAAAEPDDAALVLDTLARRLGWDAQLAGARDEGAPLARRIRAALAEDGAGPDCPYPPPGALLQAAIALAPERAACLHGLMGLAAEGPTPPVPDEALAQALEDALRVAALRLLGGWPAGARLHLLLLGPAGPALLASLAEHPAVGLLVHAGAEPLPDADRPAMLRPLPLPQALAGGPYDAVLSAGGLSPLDATALRSAIAAMAPGAVLLAAEPEPSLLRDLIHGQVPGWWRIGGEEETPRGPLRTGAGWLDRLAGEGLRNAALHPLNGAAAPAVLLSATAPRRVPEPPRTTAPSDLALHLVPEDAADPLTVPLAAALTGLGVRTSIGGTPPPGAGTVLIPADDDPDRLADRLAVMGERLAAGPRRLWCLLRGEGPAAAGLRAALRVAMNEHPAADCRSLTLAAGTVPDQILPRLAACLADPGPERELRLDGAGLSAARMTPAGALAAAASPPPGSAMILTVARAGDTDSLGWQPAPRRAPGPREVEIAIRASGLNFRDVLRVQGLLPEEAVEDGHAGATLGMECAGDVVRAGPDCGLRPGMRVIAFAPQSLASHATLPAAMVAPLAAGIDYCAGATLPVAYLTAQYALAEVARLRPGEHVLIHGGAGGVGLAAISVARHLGARIIATAGTPAKRALLKALGAETVFDSRDLAFADGVRAATGGRGVDVVLNSLAGPALERSIGCLAAFGRFVELGKRDLLANSRIGLRPFRANLSFHAVDADALAAARPAMVRELFAEIARRLAEGHYAPLPYRAFGPAQVADAMRLMQRSGHIGKIVVEPPPPREGSAPLGRGAWLVTGGLGGFGLATAEWLAAQGVRRLWLVSRSGRTQEPSRIAALTAAGVAVSAAACDVTDASATHALVARIAEDGPLEGVVHGAMVMADGLLASLDPRQAARAIGPKLTGARLLDRATRPLGPRHFVLYGSLAAPLGNPGQAAYAAANAAMEGLARDRRDAGLPALAIAWGPIRDAGHLARNEELRAAFEERLAGALMGAQAALDTLGVLLRHPDPPAAVTVAPIPWRRLRAQMPGLSAPRFSLAIAEGTQAEPGEPALAPLLRNLPRTEAARRLLALLVARTARILRQPEAGVDPFRPIADLGMDSLMLVELRLSVEEQLGAELPALTMGEGSSLSDLSQRLLDRITGDPSEEVDGPDPALTRLIALHGAPSGQIDPAFVQQVLDRTDRTASARENAP